MSKFVENGFLKLNDDSKLPWIREKSILHRHWGNRRIPEADDRICYHRATGANTCLRRIAELELFGISDLTILWLVVSTNNFHKWCSSEYVLVDTFENPVRPTFFLNLHRWRPRRVHCGMKKYCHFGLRLKVSRCVVHRISKDRGFWSAPIRCVHFNVRSFCWW